MYNGKQQIGREGIGIERATHPKPAYIVPTRNILFFFLNDLTFIKYKNKSH